jgi:hypothetical protein
VILFLLVASAVMAPPASAQTTTSELRARLRSSRRALRDSRARLTRAREDLAAARLLLAAFSDIAVEDVIEGDPADAVADDAWVIDPAAVDAAAVEPAAVVPSVDGPALGEEASVDAASVDADSTVPEAEPAPEAIAPTLAEVDALADRVVKARRSARGWKLRVEDLARRVRRRERIADWNRRGAWRPLIELAARQNGISAAALYRLMQYESGGRRYAGATYKGLFQYLPGTWRASWNPFRGASIYDGWAQIRATAYAIKRGYGPSMWPSTYPRAF